MWCTEPVIRGGTAGRIFISYGQDARDARFRWANEHEATTELVAEKSKEVSRHLETARRGKNFNFITNFYYSCLSTLNSVESLLDSTMICLSEMDRMLEEAEGVRVEVLSRLSPIISSVVKAEIRDEVRLLDDLRGKVTPERNDIRKQRHELQVVIKRLQLLTDEIKHAVGKRYGVQGQNWLFSQEAQARRQHRSRI
jgi:hypothetical protein